MNSPRRDSFRADLYYRLAGYVLEIPPLRERREDIPPLVEHFMRQCATELNRTIRGLTVHALRMLTEYPWPGNVRELGNEVRRSVYLCADGRTIESSILSRTIRENFAERGESVEEALESGAPLASQPAGDGRFPAEGLEAGDGRGEGTGAPPFALGLDSLDLEELESRAIEEALRRCANNQVQAAKLLGISRQKLRRRMEKMGLLKPATRRN
ncbi:MAG: helix-turn-helix domain-containing protein [Acidobacteriota bacterium]